MVMFMITATKIVAMVLAAKATMLHGYKQIVISIIRSFSGLISLIR
jgi:hypothetical protein